MPTTAPQPLFHRTYQEIAARIDRGDLVPGDRLPSERWFGDDLGVSRTTVRRAIEELVDRGLVEDDGRGLLVAGTRASENRLLSLTELARARGLESSARVLTAAVRPATLDEADLFGLAPGADLFDLRRVRLLDGLEISVDRDRVPRHLLSGASSIDFTTASLYGELEDAGVDLVEARTQIEAAGASTEEAAQLGLESGAPVLVATEQVVDRGGRVVSQGRTVYRSDRHRFLTTFTRTPRRPADSR